jgi:hypothetical protein
MLKRQTGTFGASSTCVTMRDKFPAQTAFNCAFEDFANTPAEPEIISVSGEIATLMSGDPNGIRTRYTACMRLRENGYKARRISI